MTDNSIKCPKNKHAVDAFSLVCSRMKELNHLYGQNGKEWELAFSIFAAGMANANHVLGEGYSIPCSCGNPLHSLHVTPPCSEK